ncbi:MAG: hypothetical protein CVV49_20565 [Spirochaetae bacterium HGW-Spirochaetae-5]|nr:MAG: hypothetical protein CVV49_20565 [Spirochaetae bacterium HGW-Spirochaetae-5]
MIFIPAAYIITTNKILVMKPAEDIFLCNYSAIKKDTDNKSNNIHASGGGRYAFYFFLSYFSL